MEYGEEIRKSNKRVTKKKDATSSLVLRNGSVCSDGKVDSCAALACMSSYFPRTMQ